VLLVFLCHPRHGRPAARNAWPTVRGTPKWTRQHEIGSGGKGRAGHRRYGGDRPRNRLRTNGHGRNGVHHWSQPRENRGRNRLHFFECAWKGAERCSRFRHRRRSEWSESLWGRGRRPRGRVGNR